VSDPIIRVDGLNIQTMKIPISDPYGNCNTKKDMVRYLTNKKLICSYKMTMNYDSCIRFNENVLLRNLTSFVTGYNNSSILKINSNITYYNVVDNMYYNEVSSPSLESTIGIISTGCKCPGIIKKIKISFMMKNAIIEKIQIDYFIQDIKDICNAIRYVPVTYEVEFMGNNQVNILKTD
jgi:hypothetical protein